MTMSVVHEAFAKAIGDVDTASARLAADRDDADRRVRGFLAAGWTGVAAEAFADAWDDWKVAADQVKDGLDTMRDLLVAVQRDWIQQDHASQKALDSLSTRILDRLG